MLTHHSQLEGVKEGHQGDKRLRACQNKMHLTVGHAVLQGYLERQNHYCSVSIFYVTDTFKLLKAVVGKNRKPICLLLIACLVYCSLI